MRAEESTFLLGILEGFGLFLEEILAVGQNPMDWQCSRVRLLLSEISSSERSITGNGPSTGYSLIDRIRQSTKRKVNSNTTTQAESLAGAAGGFGSLSTGSPVVRSLLVPRQSDNIRSEFVSIYCDVAATSFCS